MFLYFLVIFALEAIWSYLADMAIVKTVTRKRWMAVVYDIAALSIAYFVLRMIAREDWPIILIVAAILGGATGTFFVANRKIKRKKKPIRKKIPTSTA